LSHEKRKAFKLVLCSLPRHSLSGSLLGGVLLYRSIV